MSKNFEEDLEQLQQKLQDDNFAQHLYATLCNNDFINIKTKKQYSCSWRYAGGLVSSIRNKGEDYLDFYCSGNEGKLYPDVMGELAILGWYTITEIDDTHNELEVPPNFEIRTKN